MAISATVQLRIFLLSLGAGALAGIFFDGFRAFRRLVRSGVLWVGVQDILYWLLSACAAFAFLYRVNDGQMRWYIFLGILLGALFYHLLLQDKMVRLFLALAHALYGVLKILVCILLFPLRILYKILRPVFLFFYRIFARFWKKCKRILRRKREQVCCTVKKLKKRIKMY